MCILPEHKELLLTQSESKTLPEWLNYFDNKYTRNQISSYCYRNKKRFKQRTKEEISQNARKWHINQDYFKTWSHNMAYILGFWFADGCIYRNQMFDITIHKKDKYILKQIAKELEYEGPIMDYVDRQACRLNFSCVVIYNDIVKLGGKECKSMDITFPNIPNDYMPDFIRGFFDGDGSIYYVKDGRVGSAFTCGSKEFLFKLVEVLRQEAGIKGGSYDETNYTYRFGKKDTRLIGEYMYKNNPELFLLRKKQKFKEEKT